MKGTLLSDSVLAGPNIHIYIYSGEFIATSHNLGLQKVAKEGKSPFQEDLGASKTDETKIWMHGRIH